MIRVYFFLIKLIVGELKKLHQSRIKPKFTEDDSVLDQKISKVTHELYNVIKQCEENIKQVSISLNYNDHIEIQSNFPITSSK